MNEATDDVVLSGQMMGKDASERGRPLVVNRNDFIHALTMRVFHIRGLVARYSESTDLSSTGMRLLRHCYAAAKDDLSKETQSD